MTISSIEYNSTYAENFVSQFKYQIEKIKRDSECIEKSYDEYRMAPDTKNSFVLRK